MLGLRDGQRSIHEQADHVDTAGLPLTVRRGAIELEEHAQLALLALVDSLLGCAEPSTTPGFDLDEDKGVPILGNDVDLPET